MTYALSPGLQAAVYARLSEDAALADVEIHDALPEGSLPQTYVLLGAEEVRDRSDGSGAGALHRFTLSVLSDAAGFAAAKQTAGAICDALDAAPLALARGRLVALRFERASARRSSDGSRRIDLRFAARVEDA